MVLDDKTVNQRIRYFLCIALVTIFCSCIVNVDNLPSNSITYAMIIGKGASSSHAYDLEVLKSQFAVTFRVSAF